MAAWGTFARDREDMVKGQIMGRGIHDPLVLEAMLNVPRHRFVPEESAQRAYEDHPLEIGHGQTISQPYMVALMTELLKLSAGARVLEVGTGSGYQAAILSVMAAQVVTMERVGPLADAARERLKLLGYDNVTVVVGDGTLGYPEASPYDGIVVTAGGPVVPEALKEQLAEGGRLVCPVGPREIQKLTVVTRTKGGFSEERGIGCMFVPLIGSEGWTEAS